MKKIQKIIRSITSKINFVEKVDVINSPKPENQKITAANLNEIKIVVNNNSTILQDLISNPPATQTRFFQGEIKQFEKRTDLDFFLNNLGLVVDVDYLIFNEKFFLNNNPNSSGQYFSGGNSILTNNHLPYYNLTHYHELHARSKTYNSRGGSSVGLLAESNLRSPLVNFTDPSPTLVIGTTSPQTIYNLIYYKDVITIKFLRNI